MEKTIVQISRTWNYQSLRWPTNSQGATASKLTLDSSENSDWSNTFIKETDWIFLKNLMMPLQVSKINDIELTMTFELYFDLSWTESRFLINESSTKWGEVISITSSLLLYIITTKTTTTNSNNKNNNVTKSTITTITVSQYQQIQQWYQ